MKAVLPGKDDHINYPAYIKIFIRNLRTESSQESTEFYMFGLVS